MLGDVAKFHKKHDHPVLDKPALPEVRRVILRHVLLVEEFAELIAAILGVKDEHKIEMLRLTIHNTTRDWMDDFIEDITDSDVPGVAKEVCDLLYVVLGTALEYGIPMDDVWPAVHQSNMTKPDLKNAHGKTIKDETWEKPNVLGILEFHGWQEPSTE